jgi:hypothetical protein
VWFCSALAVKQYCPYTRFGRLHLATVNFSAWLAVLGDDPAVCHWKCVMPMRGAPRWRHHLRWRIANAAGQCWHVGIALPRCRLSCVAVALTLLLHPRLQACRLASCIPSAGPAYHMSRPCFFIVSSPVSAFSGLLSLSCHTAQVACFAYPFLRCMV